MDVLNFNAMINYCKGSKTILRDDGLTFGNQS